ncbi:MAG: TIGR03936 family radical SAM-associated protein [Candidatus Obscuribacterales bacterium]|nr:TIGR03936 family radical SAM-associated protein [Candidatus Obscuribacterales bacterium]
MNSKEFSTTLTEELLQLVVKPGQYLGNEWNAINKSFDDAKVRLVLAFPDIYELGMSNFGLKILYKIVNGHDGLMVDRSYAPGSDMEDLIRGRNIPLWAWESRRPISDFDLIGFSLQYELTYTNVLNMLELANIPEIASDRTSCFPLIFGGGPSAVNPEPMALFMDLYMIGDGEQMVPHAMRVIEEFKDALNGEQLAGDRGLKARRRLLLGLARQVPGVYVPELYILRDGDGCVTPMTKTELDQHLGDSTDDVLLVRLEDVLCLELDKDVTGIPPRVFRQVAPLNSDNQPTGALVSYLSLIHDREVLEVRRGCDRGCRFCQPGYTFLPVRERSAEDILDLSKKSLQNSGHEEYSLLSLCVSDYTSLYDTVRSLNREHSTQRASLSFPSQRADRMNMDIAEELKTVRRSGITLAPEAGTERMRGVINKGLSHEQIISAIESAFSSGWTSVKLYFMCCLPTEQDEDLVGIIDILKEATLRCRAIRKTDPEKFKRGMEFTCTISNFVPKPFTPFQWFGQITREETRRKHEVLHKALRDSGLGNVQLNKTEAEISLLESVISRGGREMAEMIHRAWKKGCKFDAWDDRFQPALWHAVASDLGTTLEDLACVDREVGSTQPWDVIHVGLHSWWLVKEWEKALAVKETANCTENTCHACGVCTELDAVHELAAPDPIVMKKNPFVKELNANVEDEDSHPSLFVQKPQGAPSNETLSRFRFLFTKCGELRFVGHLDIQHLLIRASRRASLRLAYTQGFNPSPKLSLASPLPLYFEGEGEVAEIELSELISAVEFKSRLNRQLPPEVQIQEVITLNEKPSQSLSAVLNSATYRAVLVSSEDPVSQQVTIEELTTKVSELLGRESILVDQADNSKRKSKNKRNRSEKPAQRDIREGIKSLVVCQGPVCTLEMELACGPQLHVKPSEVLECIDTRLRWRLSRLSLIAGNGAELLKYDRTGVAGQDSQSSRSLTPAV